MQEIMKITILNLLVGGAAILLASCSSGEQAAQVPANEAKEPSVAETKISGKEPTSKKGGQVVESGKYHLELVPEKSANETHLDLFVLNTTDHQAIAGAKVSGEIQSPDGQVKPITFNYDAEGKHYTGIVPGKTTGAYQLKVTATIDSNKADGRFSFNR
jgi:hypothetical protein